MASAHARAVSTAGREALCEHLRARLSGRHFVLLQTCQRIEAYVEEMAPTELDGVLPDGARVLVAGDAIRHAVEVAVGSDSTVVGEDQVLHQVRQAVATARDEGHLGRDLDRLFTSAVQAGRQARSWRQGPSRSLADLALDAIEQQTGPLKSRAVLVVGSGDMGSLAARASGARGASVSVTSRSSTRAAGLASITGAQALPFDPGARLSGFSGIVIALRGHWRLCDPSAAHLVRSEAVVVDLSDPPAVDEALRERLTGRYLSLDELTAIGTSETPSAATERLRALIESTCDGLDRWFQGRNTRKAIAAIAAQAERERQSEMDGLWMREPAFDEAARSAVDAMSRHLTQRLLREPLARLAHDREGRLELAARDLFGL